MVNLNDKIRVPRKNNQDKFDTLYRCTCDRCGADRGYQVKAKQNNMCRECSGLSISLYKLGKPGPNIGNRFSEETRKKMSDAKKGRTPWNKGRSGISVETRQKMSLAKLNKSPPNKGTTMTLEQRIKLSCANQNIDADKFNGFTSPFLKAEREKFYALNMHKQCFKRDNYTCDKCSQRGRSLNAHHLNSFAHFPEERFLLDNLVTLCRPCHKAFHAYAGNGKSAPNTKGQYMAFKNGEPIRKTVYILTGAPASGKSWVASQLVNFDVIDSDVVSKKELVGRCEQASKPILTLTVGVSTFMLRNPQFDCRLIVIVEDEATINSRMLARGGKITDTIKRRIKRMEALCGKAEYTGTSSQVLQYLNLVFSDN